MPGSDITIACLDIAGTTVADEGVVQAAFTAALDQAGLPETGPDRYRALATVRATMGQSKVDVFHTILGSVSAAQRASLTFESAYAAAVAGGQVTPIPGAPETLLALRAAGIRICLATGFSPATRDAVIDALGWRRVLAQEMAERAFRRRS